MKYFILNGIFCENRPQGPAFKEALDAHHQYLAQFVQNGTVLLCGPKPGGGGVILLKCAEEADVQKICQEDPFVNAGVLKYEIIPFNMFAGQECIKGWFE